MTLTWQCNRKPSHYSLRTEHVEGQSMNLSSSASTGPTAIIYWEQNMLKDRESMPSLITLIPDANQDHTLHTPHANYQHDIMFIFFIFCPPMSNRQWTQYYPLSSTVRRPASQYIPEIKKKYVLPITENVLTFSCCSLTVRPTPSTATHLRTTKYILVGVVEI